MALNGSTNGHASHDIEKEARVDHHDDRDGAALGKQVSIQLSPEQYERLFFQPGGPSRGDAAKRLANPTVLGICGFIICLTPTSMFLMQFRGAGAASVPVLVGAYYFVGGLCMTLAAVGEFLLGNTFPMVVFSTFGGFWLSFGILNDPAHNILSAFEQGAASRAFNSGVALYFVAWAMLCFVYFIAGLRTNAFFEVIFFTLVFAFSFLAAGYWHIGYATTAADTLYALKLLKAAGAFSFVTSLAGWYLAIVLAAASTGVPLPLPVGDLSGFLARG